ncbi:gliding motility-associated C-terminal domain-containing protein [Segetibacter sp. 3557_3]|uniref:gliding motility-associated C-terminal domain-containing protein n=1 Tax=Segetibacter sp. 3557_3 TaxID=2547429 RepID=UPI0014050431|nr:gliding motility-associated C-terminal domain-containing protein [Segetibacter sp. 3557_3]
MSNAYAQLGACPPNIGFEDGSFNKWECFSGKVTGTGLIDVPAIGSMSNVHTISDNNGPQAVDPYGKFPVNCPNGSRYSIRLGNDQNGAQAERVSYTFNIPANMNDYSIIYNYAVVFQNPNHAEFQQPRFTSRVFDVTSNQYVSCGSFEFVASSSLLGFQQSSLGQNVFYKPWSPITINLNGYAGKTIRLEFTNNDCTLGGHFGYAYLDVNENCSTPITGNIYCNGSDSLRLKAPFGFQQYRWFNADFSQVLGTTNTLLLAPPPPPNTTFGLEIVPYPNLGCKDTLYSTVVLSPESFVFQVRDTVEACAFSSVDLTAPAVTSGSSPGLTYSYFRDISETEYLANPNAVKQSGTYYIKAVNATGCNDIRAVTVLIRNPPSLLVTNPPEACSPATVDLTTSLVTVGSDPGLVFSYWRDSLATTRVANPEKIDQNGTFYIRAQNSIGCHVTRSVRVSIAIMNLVNQTSCGNVDLTLRPVTEASSPGLTYTYFKDPGATEAVPDPKLVSSSGTYYIKGTNTTGCSIVQPVLVTVNPLPVINVINPVPVVFPATVNVSTSFANTPGVDYTFWSNPAATSSTIQPTAIGTSGTYYIRARNQFGCLATQPVVVVISPPPLPKIVAPNAFSPNNDGINDVFRPVIDGQIAQYYLRIMNRYGQEVFGTPDITRYWNGSLNGNKLPVGTYYWIFEGTDLYRESKVTQSGSVTLLR